MATEILYPAHEPNRCTLWNASVTYANEYRTAKKELTRARRELREYVNKSIPSLRARGWSEAELAGNVARMEARIVECVAWMASAKKTSNETSMLFHA